MYNVAAENGIQHISTDCVQFMMNALQVKLDVLVQQTQHEQHKVLFIGNSASCESEKEIGTSSSFYSSSFNGTTECTSTRRKCGRSNTRRSLSNSAAVSSPLHLSRLSFLA
jgi:hypothetical protein